MNAGRRGRKLASRLQVQLFDPGSVQPKQRPTKPKRRHLSVVAAPTVDAQVRMAADKAGWATAADGLPARVVKDHSAEKSWAVRRDLDTVGRAMTRQWWPVHYLELFCGPGILVNDSSGAELPGSPLEALGIKQPLDRYVFSDLNPVCTDALHARIGERPDVFVRRGDANDRDHLEALCALIDPKALVIAYLDPAKPNLHWSTVEFLANRFQRIDLLINLPFSAIHRALSVGHTDGPRRMLNHPDPLSFLSPDEGKVSTAIREHYKHQLRGLGFEHLAWRSVLTRTTRSPLYDVILASRNARAVDLFEKANRVTHAGQIGLDLA